MKILLVCRGSQGDIYPYLALASALVKQGYELTLSLPAVFEKDAQSFGINYVVQGVDDIPGMIETAANTRDLLAWTQRVIRDQFKELIPLLQEHDILVSSNTEFAAPSIAEYCRKTLIRTAYAPLLPGRKLPPPVMPWQKPNPLFTPGFQWKVLNMGLNLMVKKILNIHRQKLGLSPIADQGEHAPAHAQNYLMYSPSLGDVDPDWPYPWKIGGYCFNDRIPYNEIAYQTLKDFIQKDQRPTIFFTMGSCTSKKGDRFCSWLFEICEQQGYKLVVGAGWWKLGNQLKDTGKVFVLDTPMPHYLIFPACDAIIHHGGSGTTHSAGRFGKPQMVTPLILDQHYWGYRVARLGIGPDYVNIARISRQELEKKVLDLMTNPIYKKNAAVLGEQIRSETGIHAFCEYLARYRKD
jgi:UDP:flavonoid glycosyltransferase YjiC (YdhE family)